MSYHAYARHLDSRTLFQVQLSYPTTTAYQKLPGTRCCDNCEPDKFPIEKIVVSKPPGLKRGKKKNTPKEQEDMLRNTLKEWRDTKLLDHLYPGLSSISGRTILGDDIIEKIACCGERLKTYDELRQHARWTLGHDEDSGGPSPIGRMLLDVIGEVYQQFDNQEKEAAAEQQKRREYTFITISPKSFYQKLPARKSGTRRPNDQGNLSDEDRGSNSEPHTTVDNTPVSEQATTRGRGHGRGRGRPRGSRGTSTRGGREALVEPRRGRSAGQSENVQGPM